MSDKAWALMVAYEGPILAVYESQEEAEQALSVFTDACERCDASLPATPFRDKCVRRFHVTDVGCEALAKVLPPNAPKDLSEIITPDYLYIEEVPFVKANRKP